MTVDTELQKYEWEVEAIYLILFILHHHSVV